MDWHDLKLVGTIIGGLLISAMLSTARSWLARCVAIVVGLFSALVFTEPLIHWLGLEFSVYQYAVAGILSMSGDRLARRGFELIDSINLPRNFR